MIDLDASCITLVSSGAPYDDGCVEAARRGLRQPRGRSRRRAWQQRVGRRQAGAGRGRRGTKPPLPAGSAGRRRAREPVTPPRRRRPSIRCLCAFARGVRLTLAAGLRSAPLRTTAPPSHPFPRHATTPQPFTTPAGRSATPSNMVVAGWRCLAARTTHGLRRRRHTVPLAASERRAVTELCFFAIDGG
jgi:hypothetical protein